MDSTPLAVRGPRNTQLGVRSSASAQPLLPSSMLLRQMLRTGPRINRLPLGQSGRDSVTRTRATNSRASQTGPRPDDEAKRGHHAKQKAGRLQFTPPPDPAPRRAVGPALGCVVLCWNLLLGCRRQQPGLAGFWQISLNVAVQEGPGCGWPCDVVTW